MRKFSICLALFLFNAFAVDNPLSKTNLMQENLNNIYSNELLSFTQMDTILKENLKNEYEANFLLEKRNNLILNGIYIKSEKEK